MRSVGSNFLGCPHGVDMHIYMYAPPETDSPPRSCGRYKWMPTNSAFVYIGRLRPSSTLQIL